MLQRKIIAFLGITLLASNVYGEVKSDKYPVVSDLNLKLGAYSAFEAGAGKQNHLKSSEKNISANRDSFAFYNDTALFATISNKHEDIEYGGKIILVPTSKRKSISSYNGSHIFIESEFGRVELGSPIPVATRMKISDGSIPSKYLKKSTAHLKQNKKHAPSFLTGDGHLLGDGIVANFDKAKYSNEPPRTINYYTPKFELNENTKLQAGISYTPDSSNTGAGEANERTTGLDTKKIKLGSLNKIKIDKSVKDAVTAGVVLEHKLSKNNNFKLAFTGEYGKAAGSAIKHFKEERVTSLTTSEVVTLETKHKLANLRSYNIGGELKLSNFTFNACYGNLGKSFTTPEFHKAGAKSHYYNAGVAYQYKDTTTKLSYFGSEAHKNKVSSVKLNISHILAPGLKPYAEISSYTLKGKPEFHNELKSKSTRGTVALLGLKLTL